MTTDRDNRGLRPVELWAGIECTVNRVGDRYFDQLDRNGHAQRVEDLDRLAQLGVKTLRYPERSAALAGIDARGLIRCSSDSLGLLARRPAFSALGSRRGLLLPALEDSLARYVAERGTAGNGGV